MPQVHRGLRPDALLRDIELGGRGYQARVRQLQSLRHRAYLGNQVPVRHLPRL